MMDLEFMSGVNWRDMVLALAALIGVYLVLSVMRLFKVGGRRREASNEKIGGEFSGWEPYSSHQGPEPQPVPADTAPMVSEPKFAEELARSSVEVELERLRRESAQQRAAGRNLNGMNKARIAMNDTPTPETEAGTEAEADNRLKRRLLNRIAIAAVMVVGLLGSLAMFDAIYAPSQPEPAKMAALPPTEPAAAPVAEVKPESATVAKADEDTVPERTASPAAPPLQPLPAEKPLTRPATGRPASMRPSEPVPLATSPAARPEPVRELAQSPAVRRRAPASRPIAQAAERQYALQMGVFSNIFNAEDLRAKLEKHGVPATIEARVHVGPFKTREEVELAPS